MKIYNTEEEMLKDVAGINLILNCDVTFNFDVSCEINITARDITAWDINARDINARDINAWDINASNITAWDINAWDITASNINARDINALDINASNINALDILYFAFCCVYKSIKCLSIKGKRHKHQEPICLDGSLNIIDRSVKDKK